MVIKKQYFDSIESMYSFSGLSLGNVVAFPISGALCSNGFSEGWDSIFYVFGRYINWTYLDCWNCNQLKQNLHGPNFASNQA